MTASISEWELLGRFALAALGACVFTTIGAYGFDLSAQSPEREAVDPTRVAAQVGSGMASWAPGRSSATARSARSCATSSPRWEPG